MADSQETLNPVNNTGSNPPENTLWWNPWEVQTNQFIEQPAEQTWTLNQAQEVTPVQPAETPMQEVTSAPATGPDLSSIEPSVISEPTWTQENKSTVGNVEATPQAINNTTNSQTAINAAKKEKLTRLIKAEQKKWEKSWFLKGILSWVAITACVLAVTVIFAKDQIVNLLSDDNTTPTNLEANVIDLTSENNDEDFDNEDEDFDNKNEDIYNEEDEDLDTENENEDIYNEENENLDTENEDEDIYNEEDENLTIYEKDISDEEEDEIFEKYRSRIDNVIGDDIDNNEKLEILEEIYEEILSTNPENERLIEYIDQNIMDIQDQVYQEKVDEKPEDKTTEDSDTKELYSITHVESVDEANWVLPNHCNDLRCYGEDKEFTPCTAFKLAENLDENSNRIGNNWVCRYKDTSELVYVEFE